MQGIRRGIRGVGSVLLALGLGVGTGCTSKPLSGLVDLVRPALGSVTLTPEAVTLAVGATQQLTAVPRDTTGVPMAGLALPTFVSEDTNLATVSTSGVLQAKAAGSVRVIAKIQSDGMTLEASSMVTVTPTAAAAASVAITPDESTLGAGEGLTLTATAYTSDGTRINGVGQASYVSSNPKVARMDGSSVTAVSRGQVTIIGTINVHGKNFTDTVALTVTHPTFAYIYIFPADDWFSSHRVPFGPQVVKIAPGGTVIWANYSAYSQWGAAAKTSADVTFDNPSAVPDGNIPAITPGNEISRTFPTAGTYPYRSTTNGETGKVIVQ